LVNVIFVTHVRVYTTEDSNNKIEHHTQLNITSNSAMAEKPRDAYSSTVINFMHGVGHFEAKF